MIDKLYEKDCVLCGSCVISCPTKAIDFHRKYLDFIYPEIDMDKCIGCNKCERVCPILNPPTHNNQEYCEGYVARHCQRETRIESTSGGIFSAAAEYVLSCGGYVCGAIMDENFHVSHICSNSRTVVKKMRGSKYVQSNLVPALNVINDRLSSGKLVLFTGCPCQIAAVQSFLGGRPDNLILIELICHGIPSDNMLQSYIRLQERAANSKVKSIEFRRKTQGWHNSSVFIAFANGRIYNKSSYEDIYVKGFLTAVYLRESCYNCHFRGFRSCADIMIGDFWGAEIEFPHLDDNTGLSAVIALSKKGLDFLQKLEIEKYQVNTSIIIQYNKNIMESCAPNPLRELFYKVSSEAGYEAAMNKLLKENYFRAIIRQLRHYGHKLKQILYQSLKLV